MGFLEAAADIWGQVMQNRISSRDPLEGRVNMDCKIWFEMGNTPTSFDKIWIRP